MVDRFGQAFEAGLNKLAQGLAKPHGLKLHDKLVERIGKLKAKCRGTSQHYDVTLATNEDGKTVSAITWLKLPVAGTMATHPGLYCLRSNELTWDEGDGLAERLPRTSVRRCPPLGGRAGIAGARRASAASRASWFRTWYCAPGPARRRTSCCWRRR